jgi:hypothetical protein
MLPRMARRGRITLIEYMWELFIRDLLKIRGIRVP